MRRVFRGRRVVTRGGVRAAAVHVLEGVITAVADYDFAHDTATAVIECGDHFVLPGLVDTHVHFNSPGRTEWEGFETGTRAAAAGGVTTVVDMPLNSVPATTTADALAAKLESAAGKCAVDVAFWGGLVPHNVDRLHELADAGVRGFKCFLVPSGVDEFAAVGERELRAALPVIARLDLPLLVHAELPGPIEDATPVGDERSYATYLSSRPASAEIAAAELLIGLARETGAHIHFVHVSAADVLPRLRHARRGGVRITAETCPHYLHFTADRIPDSATEYKCAPPIRDAANRERLWAGLVSNDLDMIVSDHSPCTPALKRRVAGSFAGAWGGIASLQLGLAVVWTEARERGIDIASIVEWMCATPARLAGLNGRKGGLEPGHDADIVVFDPDAVWRVDAARLHHRHAITPYAGEQLRGIVRQTYLRGELVHDLDRDGPAGAPTRPDETARSGRILLREGTPWTSPN